MAKVKPPKAFIGKNDGDSGHFGFIDFEYLFLVKIDMSIKSRKKHLSFSAFQRFKRFHTFPLVFVYIFAPAFPVVFSYNC